MARDTIYSAKLFIYQAQCSVYWWRISNWPMPVVRGSLLGFFAGGGTTPLVLLPDPFSSRCNLRTSARSSSCSNDIVPTITTCYGSKRVWALYYCDSSEPLPSWSDSLTLYKWWRVCVVTVYYKLFTSTTIKIIGQREEQCILDGEYTQSKVWYRFWF